MGSLTSSRPGARRNPGCAEADTEFPVVTGAGSHPFPFRTRKLSLLPPMVLRGKLRGRVGRCREFFQPDVRTERRAFSLYASDPRTPFHPRQSVFTWARKRKPFPKSSSACALLTRRRVALLPLASAQTFQALSVGAKSPRWYGPCLRPGVQVSAARCVEERIRRANYSTSSHLGGPRPRGLAASGEPDHHYF